MTSVLKVDQIQTTAGDAPTTKDLGFAAGSIIQTVYNSHNTGVTLSSGGAVETGLAASITPKFASSKILVTVAQNIQTSGSSYC